MVRDLQSPEQVPRICDRSDSARPEGVYRQLREDSHEHDRALLAREELMLLSDRDVKRFYAIFYALLAYTNRQYEIIDDWRRPEDVRKHTMEEGVQIRNQWYEHPELLERFADKNPFDLPGEDINVVRSWKHFVKGTFYIAKQLKEYAVFLTVEKDPIAYGVTAITSSIEDTLYMALPIMVEAVLLPFEGKILYDSFLAPYNMAFGAGMRRSLNDAYQAAKSKHGIVTSLPFSRREQANSDDELLRHYLKNAESREYHWEDVLDILENDPSLWPVFHQEMGKGHARSLRPQLRAARIKSGWFAILDGLMIASGATEDEARKAAIRLVPNDRIDHLYVFQHREKK